MRRRFDTSSDKLPTYLDGRFELYEIVRNGGSFQVDELRKVDGKYYFRELAIYDKTRVQFQVQDKEITKKLMIPVTNVLNSKRCVIVIDNVQHEVFNSTTVYNNRGIAELELTCTKVVSDYPMEVRND